MKYDASILTRPLVIAYPKDTVFEAAKTMTEKKVGSVVVIDATGWPVGILTERDILRRVVAQNKDPQKTLVQEVMTEDPVMLESCEPLEVVFDHLGKKFRHLPITEDGRVVGMVSLTDVAKILPKVFKEKKYLKEFAEALQKIED